MRFHENKVFSWKRQSNDLSIDIENTVRETTKNETIFPGDPEFKGLLFAGHTNYDVCKDAFRGTAVSLYAGNTGDTVHHEHAHKDRNNRFSEKERPVYADGAGLKKEGVEIQGHFEEGQPP